MTINSSSTTIRVCVVDDNPLIAAQLKDDVYIDDIFIQNYLDGKSLEIKTFESGEPFIEAIENGELDSEIDLYIIDQNLGGKAVKEATSGEKGDIFTSKILDGTDIIERLAMQGIQKPIILYSGEKLSKEELLVVAKKENCTYIAKSDTRPATLAHHIIRMFNSGERHRKVVLYSKIFDTVEEELVLIDPRTCKIVYWNRYVNNKFSDEYIEKNERLCYKVFHDEHKKCDKCPLDRVPDDGKPYKSSVNDKPKPQIPEKGGRIYIKETLYKMDRPIDVHGEIYEGLILSVVDDVTLQHHYDGIKNQMRAETRTLEVIKILFEGIQTLYAAKDKKIRCRFYTLNEELRLIERLEQLGEHIPVLDPAGEDLTRCLSLPEDDWLLTNNDHFKRGYRLYTKQDEHPRSGVLTDIRYPSITYILNNYPTGIDTYQEPIGIVVVDCEKEGDVAHEEEVEYARGLVEVAANRIVKLRDDHRSELKISIMDLTERFQTMDKYIDCVTKAIAKNLKTEMTTFFLYDHETNRAVKRINYYCTGEKGEAKHEDECTGAEGGAEDAYIYELESKHQEHYPLSEKDGEANNTGTILLRSEALICNGINRKDMDGRRREGCEGSLFDEKDEHAKYYINHILKHGAIKNALYVPIRTKFENRRIGIIRCINKLSHDRDRVLERGFRNDEIEVLEKLSYVLAKVLSSAMFEEQLNKATSIVQYFLRPDLQSKLEKTLFLILSGITCGKGLGYNRAILFLDDKSYKNTGSKFSKIRANGPVNEEEKELIWKDKVWGDCADETINQFFDTLSDCYGNKDKIKEFYRNDELSVDQKFDMFTSAKFQSKCEEIDKIEDSILFPPVDELARRFYAVKETSNGPSKYYRYEDGKSIEVSNEELEGDPILKHFAPEMKEVSYPLATVKLMKGKKVFGLLYVDIRFNPELKISSKDLQLLSLFANLIGQVIEIHQTFDYTGASINSLISTVEHDINFAMSNDKIQVDKLRECLNNLRSTLALHQSADWVAEKVNVYTLLNDALKFFHIKLEGWEQIIKGPHDVWITAHEQTLLLVFDQLINNMIKHGIEDEPHEIRIETDREEDEFEVRISFASYNKKPITWELLENGEKGDTEESTAAPRTLKGLSDIVFAGLTFLNWRIDDSDFKMILESHKDGELSKNIIVLKITEKIMEVECAH